MDLASLLPPSFKDEILEWLREDCPAFDIGGYVVGQKIETAHLYCKESCVLAGVPFANAIFDYMQLTVKWNFVEGSQIDATNNTCGRVIVAEVVGPCNKLLLAERTVLNILSRGLFCRSLNC